MNVSDQPYANRAKLVDVWREALDTLKAKERKSG